MMTATALVTSRDEHGDDLIKVTYAFADSSTDIIRYGLLICDGLKGVRNRTPHMTAYLNLPKSDWHKVDDVIREPFNITYEGIESARVSVGSRMERKVPIPVTDFWIGMDYMGRECSWTEAASDLMNLCNAINEELKKYDAEDSAV